MDFHVPKRRTQRPNASQLNWAKQTESLPDPDLKEFTVEDVAKHNTKDDCWMILDHRIYNVTAYRTFHPGGASILDNYAGKDATAIFNKMHGYVNYHSLLAKYQVGTLAKTPKQTLE